MAYNEKGRVGEFVANPSNQGQGQISLFEKKLVQIETDGNNLKEIELLSMEHFGYNTMPLRKEQSILEAEKVNSDKEYGVLQAENKYEVIVENGITIDPIDLSYDTWYPIAIPSATCTKAQDIVSNGTIEVRPSNDSIILPQIAVINGDNVYGLQALSKSDTGTVGFYSSNTKLDKTDTSPILDDNNILKKDLPELNFDRGGGGVILGTVMVRMSLRETADKYRVRVIIRGRGRNSVVNEAVSGWATVYSSSKVELFIAGGYKNKRLWIGLNTQKLINGTWTDINKPTPDRVYKYIPIDIYDDSDDKWDNVEQFCIKTTHKNESSSIVNMEDTVGTLVGLELPECDITFTGIWDGKDPLEKTWSFVKSASVSPKSLDVLRTNSNIFDWSYLTYGLGNIVIGNSNINCFVISGGSVNSIIVNNDPSSIISWFNTSIQMSRIKKYYPLHYLSLNNSIGIIVRDNNTAQIAVRLNDKYTITARYDASIDINSLTISKLSIVSYKGNEVNFIATVNGVEKYYSMFAMNEMPGNKLIQGSKDIKYMQMVTIGLQDNKESISILDPLQGTPSVSARLVGVDDHIYATISDNEMISLSAKKCPTSLIVNSDFSLKESLLEYVFTGSFVSKNLSIYLPGIYGLNFYIYKVNDTTYSVSTYPVDQCTFRHVAKINSYDDGLDSFTSLPLRMEDEYPEIYNSSIVCSNSVNIGKSRFVSINGDVYESGTLSLCPANNNPLISDPNAVIYQCVHVIFSASTNQTAVYTFSELGFVLMYVIEDQIICTPVKIASGIVAVGKNSVWMCTDAEPIRVWTNGTVAKQASIKTKEDNSIVIALNYDDNYDRFITNEGYYLMTTNGDRIGIPVIGLKILYVNQFGYVASSYLQTNLNDLEFIDPSPSSDLVLIDKVGGTIGKLEKSSVIETSFSIDSNQQIMAVGQPVTGRLLSISIFAKGNGTVTIMSNSISHVITVNNANYKRFRVSIDSDLDLFQYKIAATSGVKLLQRVIGIVSLKESIYA